MSRNHIRILNSLKCPFCNKNNFYIYKLISDEYNIEFLTIYETSNFVVLPDIAPLIEGHILILPRIHYSCFGELLKEHYTEFLELKKYITELLAKLYTRPVFFEHGPALTKNAGSSVNHAHLHCLPINVNLSSNIDGKIPVRKISSIIELFFYYSKNTPYLFYETYLNEKFLYLLTNETNVPSQYLRKVVSKNLKQDKWDWKEMIFDGNYKHINKNRIIQGIKKLRV